MASSGNFSTMNPLHRASTNVQYSNGNLTFSPNSSWSTTTFTRNNMVITKDKKIYMEVHCDAQSGDYHMFGVSADKATPTASQSGSTGTILIYNGSTRINGTRTDGVVTNPSQGNIVGIAIDGSNNKVWFAINNTWQISGDPANGTNEIGTVTTNNTVGTDITFAFNQNSASTLTANFGQDSTFAGQKTAGGNADANGFGDFYYAPPTGFLALCSANLPISADIDPAQTDDDIPSKQFGVLKNSATGGDSYTGLGFRPDLVWVKWTGGDQSHGWFDSSRGTSKVLNTNSTAQEASSSGLTSFDSDGYTMGQYYNQNGREYMGWCWRCNGGTTASNSNGQTTSTVQANQEAGFSIVEYAGSLTGSGTKTIGHGLSKAPELIIIKNPNKTGRWFIQHTGLTSWNYYISFNTNTGETNASGNGSMSDPTNTVFYTNWTEGSNENPYNHIAYCWHSVEGYSKFGSYIGNSSADGTFIYTGFKPQIVIIIGLVSGSGWCLKDDTLDGFNTGTGVMEPNQTSGKYTTSGGALDLLSNGFKIRTDNAFVNSSSYDPYVYMAWGDVPFKYNNTF